MDYRDRRDKEGGARASGDNNNNNNNNNNSKYRNYNAYDGYIDGHYRMSRRDDVLRTEQRRYNHHNDYEYDDDVLDDGRSAGRGVISRGRDGAAHNVDQTSRRSGEHNNSKSGDRANLDDMAYRSGGNQNFQQKSNNPKTSSSSSCSSRTMIYVWLGFITCFLVGSIALGGVALHYSVFDNDYDLYEITMKMNYVTFDTKLQTVGSPGWLNFQKQICTDNIEQEFGKELKKCRVLDIYDKTGATALVELQVYRDNKMPRSTSYLKMNLRSAVSELTSDTFEPTIKDSNVVVTITQEAVGLSFAQSQKNNTAFNVVEKSICTAIKTKLGSSLCTNCYMNTSQNEVLTVVFYAKRATINEILLEGVLKQRRTIENAENTLKAKLNTGTVKVDAFNNVLLTAKTISVVLDP